MKRRNAHKSGRIARRSLFLIAAALAGAVLFPGAAVATDPDRDFEHRHTDLPPLGDSEISVLVGEKLANGACRYRYPTGPEIIPQGGWEMRTVAVDMTNCQKLLEEGTPTEFASFENADGANSEVLPAITASGGAGPRSLAASSTRGAWQRVYWKDAFAVVLTHDVTQINWTYNGSIVLSGNAAGYFYRIGSWGLVSKGTSQGFFSGAFRGHTNSHFASEFCLPAPLVHTYYYHNRVWGHANGTSTRSESSDSVDECVPLFKGIQAAYGQWS